jgi:ubiquinone/menaquinone biosynthesis C-methylase UbiE
MASPRQQGASRDHPVFSAAYAVLAAAGERTSLGRLRRKALAPASGRLLILGAGQGHDLAHVPRTVTRIVAVEPDAFMRRRGAARLGSSLIPAGYVAAAGEALPFRDDSFDTVLCTLVLCSVDRPDAVAAEIRRVMTPSGSLLLLEHVAAPAGTWTLRAQHHQDPAWSRVAAGCHLTRDTVDVLAAAGFDTTGIRRLPPPLVLPVLSLVAGRATVTGAST